MLACHPPQTQEVQARFSLEFTEMDALVHQAALPPAVNWPALIDRCSGNVAFAIRLLKVFESTSQQRSDEISHSVAAADLERLARAAHALAGVAGMLDAERLCDLARQLDASARARDEARAKHLADQVQSELQRCLSVIPNICAQANSN